MRRVFGPFNFRTVSSSPVARTRPSLTATALTTLNLASTVRTLALWTIRSAGPFGSSARAVTTNTARNEQVRKYRIMSKHSLELIEEPAGGVGGRRGFFRQAQRRLRLAVAVGGARRGIRLFQSAHLHPA